MDSLSGVSPQAAPLEVVSVAGLISALHRSIGALDVHFVIFHPSLIVSRREIERRALSVKPSSSGGSSGSGIGGAIAGGAASAAVGNLLNKIEGLLRRDEYAVFSAASHESGA